MFLKIESSIVEYIHLNKLNILLEFILTLLINLYPSLKFKLYF